MKTSLHAVALAAGLALTFGFSAAVHAESMSKSASAVTESDKTFFNSAAQGGMLEVKAGELAVKRTDNEDVKTFGKMMVSDHSDANKKLKKLAKDKKVELPSKLDAEHQAKLDKLDAAPKTSFDSAYVNAMVEGHEATVQLFEKEDSSTADADIKEFTSGTLPTIRHHLEKVKALQTAAPK